MRVLVLLAYWLLLLPPFLRWSKESTDVQIAKMQAAAFDSPGADAPVPPSVMLAGGGILLGHLAVARLLRLSAWQTLAALLAGSTIGAAIVTVLWRQDTCTD